jgi:hypothetical protein
MATRTFSLPDLEDWQKSLKKIFPEDPNRIAILKELGISKSGRVKLRDLTRGGQGVADIKTLSGMIDDGLLDLTDSGEIAITGFGRKVIKDR